MPMPTNSRLVGGNTKSIEMLVKNPSVEQRALDSSVDAVTVSAANDSIEAFDSGDTLAEPHIDFKVHDLFYLTVQYVSITGQPHLLFHKYLMVKKPDEITQRQQQPQNQGQSGYALLPAEKLITVIDMKIYRSSNHELIGSLSRCIELPNTLPNLRVPGLKRSVETASEESSALSLSNIETERMAQEANSLAAGIPGFHTIYFGVYSVQASGNFRLVSQRVQSISNNANVSDFMAEGLITADHRSEVWTGPNKLQLLFSFPPIAARKESLKQKQQQLKLTRKRTG